MHYLYKTLAALPLIYATNCFAHPQSQTALFAGGCFWCMEEPFDKLNGVTSTTTGYTAGVTVNPTYETVSEDETGHTEAVKITFNPEIISYRELLDVYWKNIDPYAVDEQFCDYGTQYRTGIYYFNSLQENTSRQSLQNLKTSKPSSPPIATEILPATVFYPAKGYHQDYYQNNPLFYKIIRFTCGRDRRLEELWGNRKSN